jgi:cell division protein FtsA
VPNEKLNILTAIDLGSTKTVALAAEITDQGLRYVGHGVCESRGMRKGVIADLDKAIISVQTAVQQAEDMVGAPIERAVVGVAGPHIRGVNSQGGISLGSRPREISRDDVRQTVDKARGIALPPDRQMLHLLPQEFIIDGQDGIHEPAQMVGTRLEVRVHVVTAASAPTQNIVSTMNRAGLLVDDTVLEQLAAADAVLRPDERELGVCLCDIGAGSTDIAVFYEGAVYHTGAVPVGGDHFTNDVAVGLRTPLDAAEKLKRMFGCAVVTSIPEQNEIEVPSLGDRPSRMIRQRDLGEIIEPRARELFELIRDHLQSAGVLDLCGAGFVLTGGSAKLTNLLDIVDQVTRKPGRVAAPIPLAKMPADLLDPSFATTIGLLLYAYRMRGVRAQESDSPLAKLKALFVKRTY